MRALEAMGGEAGATASPASEQVVPRLIDEIPHRFA